MPLGNILVIDDEKNIRHLIQNEFSFEGFHVTTAGTGEQGLEFAALSKFDLALVDLKLPGINGIETLKRLKQQSSGLEVIMITGHGEIQSAIESIKLGARDYITKPFKLEELIFLASQVIRDKGLDQANSDISTIRYENRDFIRCPAPGMQQLYRGISRIAPTDTTILLQGETGVGKDVLATQIHLASNRRDGLLIVLDCGMLNHNLAESELYGHRKGAFSGAGEKKTGLVEKSHGGTLFLDEIGNIDLDLQKKFLRFLETGKLRRVGETNEIRVDTRVILATNIDLEKAVEDRKMRKDLLYRMNSICLTIPPLRERPEDILPLTRHLLEQYAENKKNIFMSGEAEKILLAYPWPGNIRELKSAIIKAVLFADGNEIKAQDLPEHLSRRARPLPTHLKTLEEVERDHICRVLEKTGGHQSKAARILGINRKTLYKKIHKFGLFSDRQQDV